MTEQKKANPRNAYGEALVELGSKYNNLVVLDADLSKSTNTIMFAKKYPERFFEQRRWGLCRRLTPERVSLPVR